MAQVKTAISIPQVLLEQADALARRLSIPRSQLFSMAMGEFIQKQKENEIVKQINRAYSQELESEELERLARMKLKHRTLIKGQW